MKELSPSFKNEKKKNQHYTIQEEKWVFESTPTLSSKLILSLNRCPCFGGNSCKPT